MKTILSSRWNLAALAAAVGAATVVTLGASQLWFFSDAWPILAERELTTPGGWVKPHGGHWLVPATVGAKGTHFLFGMDFYPWYYLPRATLYAALAMSWWFVMIWRGVRPPVALAALLFISWLGTSGWIITVIYIGPIVVGLCALVAACLIDRDEVSKKSKALLFIALTTALMSSASGPALWAAAVIMIAARRRLCAFAPALVPSGVIYALWYLIFVRRDPNPLTPEPPSIGDVVAAPPKMLRLIGQGLVRPFMLGPGWEIPLAITFVLLVGALWYRGRLRTFDGVILLTGVIIVALGVLVRGAQGIRIDAPNRLYLVAAYLLIGLFPVVLPLAQHAKAQSVAAAALLVLGLANLNLLDEEIDTREQYMQVARARVETAAALIHQGDDLIPWTGVSPQANNRNLVVLVSDGWSGNLDSSLENEIRAETTVAGYLGDVPFGAPLLTGEEVDTDGCAAFEGNTDHVVEVERRGSIIIYDASGSTISITRSGPGAFSQAVAIPAEVYGVAYSAGVGPGSLSISGDWGDDEAVRICGLLSEAPG